MEAQERTRNAAAAAADQRGAGANENVAPEQQHPAVPATEPTASADQGGASSPASTGSGLPQQQQKTYGEPADASRRDYFNQRKTIRFRRQSMAPTLYRVAHPNGAPVYARTAHGGWPAPHLGIVRTVEKGKLVLCQDRQSYMFPGDTYFTYLLQVPDGWIREELLALVASVD